MFLAIRDLRVAVGRFALVAVVIGLVALLATLLSGLSNGLVNDGISGLRAQSLTHLVMQPKSTGQFSKSVVTDEQFAAFQPFSSDHVARLGMTFVNGKSSQGISVDFAIFGVDPDSFLIPRQDGRDAIAQTDTIIVSPEIAELGISVGDTVELIGPGLKLRVAGVTHEGSYGHAPIAYTSLRTWQRAFYGSESNRFSAIAVNEDGIDAAAVRAAAEEANLEVLTKEEAYDGSPGYAAETSTMALIQFFLFVISALIVGAFFTVWTVQRTNQIGLMKALGASNGYVMRDALGQLAVVIVGSTVIGGAIGYLVGQLVPAAVPFNLEPGGVLVSAVLIVVFGLVGAALALRRIVKIDPIVALAA